MLAASLTAERSLSVVRCMKTYVTSTMKNDRLYLLLDWCIFTEILNTKNRFWKSLRNSCLSVIKIMLDSMLYETLKWPQIASFCISSKKKIRRGADPDPFPFKIMACTLLSLSYAPDEQALQHPNYEYLQLYYLYFIF